MSFGLGAPADFVLALAVNRFVPDLLVEFEPVR